MHFEPLTDDTKPKSDNSQFAIFAQHSSYYSNLLLGPHFECVSTNLYQMQLMLPKAVHLFNMRSPNQDVMQAQLATQMTNNMHMRRCLVVH